MKRLLFILFLLTAFAVAGQAQTGCVELKEIDGSPDVKCVKTIRVTNGTLSCSGNVCTITISGGGGGTPGGSDTQLQYNNAGSFGGITGATTNGTFVTLTAPVLGVATGTSLTLTGDVQVGIAALYKFGGSNSLSYTDNTGPKFTDGNTTRDLIFNVQSLSANRTVTWPDASGTATLLGNSSTGSGAVVLTGTPTIATPSFTTGFTIGGTAATGTIPRGNGTNFVASTFTMAAPGTSGNVLTSDGTNWTSAAPTGGGITIGTTTITSGTNGRVLYDNAGVVGEMTTSGSGTQLALTAGPTFTGTVSGATVSLTGNLSTSVNGALSSSTGPGVTATGTWITGGSATTTKPYVLIETSGATSTAWSTSGTGLGVNSASGFTGNVLDLQVNGSSKFSVSTSAVTISPDMSVGKITASNFINAIGGIFVNPSQQVGWNSDAGFARVAAAVLRVTNNSTGAGSLVLGTSTVGSIGTSGVGVLAIANGTVPSSSPADEFQLYSADSAAGDANAFVRNEAGEINRLTGLSARNSAQFDKTNNTLAAVTGLTRNVEAGRTYSFRAVLQTTAVATGGVKFAVSGTATATAISYVGILMDGTSIIANTRATALDTTVCASTTSTAGTCEINGTIQVNAAGTLLLQFAQNNTDASASSVLANQYFQLIPIT